MPNIDVTPEVIDRLGLPYVNQARLDDLFYGHFDLPEDQDYTVKFRKIKGLPYGLHIPFSRTIHIDPIKCTKPGSKLGLGEVLVHETKHLADSVNRPFATAAHVLGRVGVRALATYGTYKAVQMGVFPNIGEFVQDCTTIDGSVGEAIEDYVNIYSVGYKRLGRIANILYYRIDPSEVGARNAHNDPDLQTAYGNAVSFPAD